MSITHPEQETGGGGVPIRNTLNDTTAFWQQQGKRLHWFKPYTQVNEINFTPPDIRIRWFQDGEINACYNCLDRHLTEKADKLALIYLDEHQNHYQFTYLELYQEVCRCANGLKALGVRSGDLVAIVLPEIPEAIICMLACARIGAVHTVLAINLIESHLLKQLENCRPDWLITGSHTIKDGTFSLKDQIDVLLEEPGVAQVRGVVVVQENDADTVNIHPSRDVWFHELIEDQETECPAESMKAESPLCVLYSSHLDIMAQGTLHSTGGYLVYASMTSQQLFQHETDQLVWCCTGLNQIEGHTYLLYGPLINGMTVFISRFQTEIPPQEVATTIDQFQINHLLCPDRLLKEVQSAGDAILESSTRTSLRSVIHTISHDSSSFRNWLYHHFGNGSCAIKEIWCENELGGVVLLPVGDSYLSLPSRFSPFPGLEVIITDNDEVLASNTAGWLTITKSWPGQGRSYYGDHQGFIEAGFLRKQEGFRTSLKALQSEQGLLILPE